MGVWEWKVKADLCTRETICSTRHVLYDAALGMGIE